MARGWPRERLPPPDVTPGAAGPRERIASWGMLPIVLLLVCWPFLLRGAPLYSWWFFLPPMAALLAALVAGGAARRGDAREVEAAQFKACLHCRYDLSRLEPEGLCPECGRAYSHQQSIRSWRWTYNTPEDQPLTASRPS